MPDWEAYQEAYKRGILPEDKKALYEEAMKKKEVWLLVVQHNPKPRVDSLPDSPR